MGVFSRTRIIHLGIFAGWTLSPDSCFSLRMNTITSCDHLKLIRIGDKFVVNSNRPNDARVEFWILQNTSDPTQPTVTHLKVRTSHNLLESNGEPEKCENYECPSTGLQHRNMRCVNHATVSVPNVSTQFSSAHKSEEYRQTKNLPILFIIEAVSIH